MCMSDSVVIRPSSAGLLSSTPYGISCPHAVLPFCRFALLLRVLPVVFIGGLFFCRSDSSKMTVFDWRLEWRM